MNTGLFALILWEVYIFYYYLYMKILVEMFILDINNSSYIVNYKYKL